MKTSLYYLAILPNSKISAEITAFKQYAAVHFNTNRALRSPPHITLIPPFRWPEGQIYAIANTLKSFAKQTHIFELQLKDFEAFLPRVIFIQPEKHPQLIQLQSDLKISLEEQNNLIYQDIFGFHPHITVAFKDLKEDIFPIAWKYFKQLSYFRTFTVDNITLLKHNGKVWEIFQAYSLASS